MTRGAPQPPTVAGLRLAVIDDSLLIREGLSALLRARGAEVVATAAEPTQGLVEIARSRPNVVLLDMRMPPSFTDEGVLAATEIRRQHPHLGILVFAQEADGRHVERLLAGLRRGIGYLLKDRVTDFEQLASALTRVRSGGMAVDPAVVEALMAHRARGGEADPLDRLTARERTVLAMMAEGLMNTAIARGLSISERTVESHVRSLFDKLGVLERTDENRRVLAVVQYLRGGDSGGPAAR